MSDIGSAFRHANGRRNVCLSAGTPEIIGATVGATRMPRGGPRSDIPSAVAGCHFSRAQLHFKVLGLGEIDFSRGQMRRRKFLRLVGGALVPVAVMSRRAVASARNCGRAPLRWRIQDRQARGPLSRRYEIFRASAIKVQLTTRLPPRRRRQTKKQKARIVRRLGSSSAAG